MRNIIYNIDVGGGRVLEIKEVPQTRKEPVSKKNEGRENDGEYKAATNVVSISERWKRFIDIIKN